MSFFFAFFCLLFWRGFGWAVGVEVDAEVRGGDIFALALGAAHFGHWAPDSVESHHGFLEWQLAHVACFWLAAFWRMKKVRAQNGSRPQLAASKTWHHLLANSLMLEQPLNFDHSHASLARSPGLARNLCGLVAGDYTHNLARDFHLQRFNKKHK